MKSLPLWARLCLLLSFAVGLLPNFALATSGPTITAQPQPAYVNQGASTTLSVTATASSTLTYQWELNGSAIPGANGSSLTISNAQSNESGNYDVVVSASAISITSAQVSITVIVPPSINPQPTSPQTAIDGNFFQLFPNIAGSSSITYVWTKNGVVQPALTQSYLYFYPATTASAGTYVLTATNSAGSASTGPIVVNVVEPILVANAPDQTVAAGANVTFMPAISGPGTFTYQWYGPNGAITGATSATLTLTNVSAHDAGGYGIQVSNAYQNNVANNQTTLTVNGPPYFNFQTPSESIFGGYGIYLNASAQGSGPITYQWSKDGVPLQDITSKISGSVTNLLYINATTVNDAGVYTIVATNSFGSTKSSDITVTFLSNSNAPIITTQPVSAAGFVGSPVTFSVSATDPVTYDTLSYQWYKGSIPIAGAVGSSIILPSVATSDAGTYSVAVSNSSGSTTSTGVVLTVGAAATLPVVTVQPVSQTVSAGLSLTLTTAAIGNPTPTIQWKKNGVSIAGATNTTLTIPSVQSSDVGDYTALATNMVGSALSSAATITVGPAGTLPVITTQPQSQTANIGGSVTLTVAATGTPAPTFQWLKNGAAIAGATSTSLVLSNLQTTDAGSYTVSVTNAAGSTTSSAATVSVTALPTARVVNLSTRAQVGTGDNILIAGFIINGSTPKKMLVRAVGPALTNYGINNFLADPSLKIVDSNGNTVATNDDWSVTSDLAGFTATSTQVGAVPFAAGSKDSALVATLAPGGYTALVTGNNNTTGVALVELYEVDTNTTNQLINISSRAQVGTGASVTIAGLIVSGSSPQKFLVRAIGPGLQARGVAAFLADPQFDIVASSTGKTIATNDDWESSTSVDDVKAVTASMGVSPLLAGSKDSALTITLAPGGYTVVVRGSNSSSGIALVELYQVP